MCVRGGEGGGDENLNTVCVCVWRDVCVRMLCACAWGDKLFVVGGTTTSKPRVMK